jgi:hypothetical protein
MALAPTSLLPISAVLMSAVPMSLVPSLRLPVLCRHCYWARGLSAMTLAAKFRARQIPASRPAGMIFDQDFAR